MQLPDDLRVGIEEELASTPPRDLQAAALALSARYRSEHARPIAPALRSTLDTRAYVAYRMPATFAALAAVFRDVRDRLPGWSPRSYIDVGGGPGTAAWAATEVWPEMERIVVIERDADMIALGRALGSHARAEAIRNAQWLRADLTTLSGSDQFDLAGAGYVLGELPPDTIAPLLATLWTVTDGVCVVVEPGTPRGYGLTREAGEALEAAGARIIAPFPTSWPCLEHEKDWVHFAERVPRTRIHRLVKDASLSYEDEKFSYVAASRVEAGSMGARVVRQPQIRSGHVRLTLCTPQGVRHIVVGKSQRDAYRLARKLRWGSALNEEDASVLGLTDEAPSVSGRGS